MPSDWPFEDKVLAWLVPQLRMDIRAFHAGRGSDMAGLFEQHQREHLDEDVYRRLRSLVLRASVGLAPRPPALAAPDIDPILETEVPPNKRLQSSLRGVLKRRG